VYLATKPFPCFQIHPRVKRGTGFTIIVTKQVKNKNRPLSIPRSKSLPLQQTVIHSGLEGLRTSPIPEVKLVLLAITEFYSPSDSAICMYGCFRTASKNVLAAPFLNVHCAPVGEIYSLTIFLFISRVAVC
jgi:hypothetical protein